MSVSYRPIKPQEAWLSLLASGMTISERYGLLYLLTSPHTNTIGCYPLVLKIAAAEAGLSSEELLNVFERLEDHDVAYYRSGFVLVRTWFRHSTWESTFTGNVAKAAARDAAAIPASMQQLWLDACVEAGVPVDILKNVLAKALPSPMGGPCKGLHDNNNNGNATELVTETTTTKESEPYQSGGSCGGDQIFLLPIAEVHRPEVEMLRTSHQLTTSHLQDIAYELSQRLEDEASGRGKPIVRVASWLKKLAATAADGQHILDRGLSLALKHSQEVRREREALISTQSEHEAVATNRATVMKLLLDLPNVELEDLAELAVSVSESIGVLPKKRDSIREAVRARILLNGLPGEAIIGAMTLWIKRRGAQE